MSLDIVLDCKITDWICAFLLFSLFLETLKKLRKRLKRNFFPTYQLCPTCLIVDFSSLTDVSDSHNRFLLYLMLWHQDKGVQLKSSITQKHFAEKVGQADTSTTFDLWNFAQKGGGEFSNCCDVVTLVLQRRTQNFADFIFLIFISTMRFD